MNIDEYLKTLNETGLTELSMKIRDRREWLRAEPFIREAQGELVDKLRDQGALPKRESFAAGKPWKDIPTWVDPAGQVINMYDEGDHVRHIVDGTERVWRSVHPLNDTEPGAGDEWVDASDDWGGPREATEDKTPADALYWQIYTDYKVGDYVQYGGGIYAVAVDHKSSKEIYPGASGYYRRVK